MIETITPLIRIAQPRELERRLGRVVGEVEARVRLYEVKANKGNDEDEEGNENERRRLVEEGSSIYVGHCLDSRLVAVLAFMRRVLTRVVRPPTLFKAAMQALALAKIKLGEGEVILSHINLSQCFTYCLLAKSQNPLLTKVPTSVQQRFNSWPSERQVK